MSVPPVDPHLARLLADLSRPQAWPVHGEPVVVQTHASVVFLVGDHVWKIRKPVDLGFLDYSTPERRERFAHLEVTLNRRLAPDVYLGVEPVVEGPDGRLRLGGDGEVVEHAVHMRRLPDEATLRHALVHERLLPEALVPVAERLAAFHREADRSALAASFGRFEVVARLARDNVDALLADADALGRGPTERLAAATAAELARVRPLIEARAARGVPCAFHGDLRLEHVYRFPDAPPPGDVVVLDGVEFDDALRHGDPVADIAFLVMDLQAYGGWPCADALAHAWTAAMGDPEAGDLFPLYVAYRAAVRAKVALVQRREPEIPADARDEALARARRHVRVALGALLPPAERPRLVLTAGLPGSGKSTVARALAPGIGATVIRTDEVRKGLAGLSPTTPAAAPPGGGLYDEATTRRTYGACLDRARAALDRGEAVVVDGNFRSAEQRAPFRELARELGARLHVLRCEAPDEVLRQRLRDRRGDASDADVAVLDFVRHTWEPPTGPDVVTLDTSAPDALGRARAALGLGRGA